MHSSAAVLASSGTAVVLIVNVKNFKSCNI